MARKNPDQFDDTILDEIAEGVSGAEQATKTIPTPVPGRKLPEGFENPPGGDPEHRCIDITGKYDPEYKQILLERIYDHDHDPQPVGLAGTILRIPREKWCDVPAWVPKVLADAIEEQHSDDFDPSDILNTDTTALKPVRRVVKRRRRFSYRVMDSA